MAKISLEIRCTKNDIFPLSVSLFRSYGKLGKKWSLRKNHAHLIKFGQIQESKILENIWARKKEKIRENGQQEINLHKIYKLLKDPTSIKGQ